ncbi:hypothetical protein AT5A_08140 [Agrobacterium tumefaciens 5A]|jgi:hypothetical protein|nr:hypothetical protein AT5A_08140 [Agrobacterium tumefaciens 5A]
MECVNISGENSITIHASPVCLADLRAQGRAASML